MSCHGRPAPGHKPLFKKASKTSQRSFRSLTKSESLKLKRTKYLKKCEIFKKSNKSNKSRECIGLKKTISVKVSFQFSGNKKKNYNMLPKVELKTLFPPIQNVNIES